MRIGLAEDIISSIHQSPLISHKKANSPDKVDKIDVGKSIEKTPSSKPHVKRGLSISLINSIKKKK